MSDKDFDLVDEVFGRYRMHTTSSGREHMDRFDLKEPHKMVLDELDKEEWVGRGSVVDELELSEESVKVRLGQLVERGYVEERKNPNDQRKKQYRVR